MTKELNQMTDEELGQLFPIILSEPNPEWSFLFIAEKQVIAEIIGNDCIVRIEHIGSTSIPNLVSKPTIDILVEISEQTDTEKIIAALTNTGYYYIHKPENPPPHMMFAKGYTKHGFIGQAFHLHIRYPGEWNEIYFRDYLRNHPETAKEYAKLKRELAIKYRNNRGGYTSAKTEFVKQITAIAK